MKYYAKNIHANLQEWELKIGFGKSGKAEQLLEYFHLDSNHIAEEIR